MKELTWAFDFDWFGPHRGVPSENILQALAWGCGSICRRLDGSREIGKWDVTTELWRFADWITNGKRSYTSAAANACWAVAWIRNDRAVRAAKVARATIPGESIVLDWKDGGRAVPRRTGYISLEHHEVVRTAFDRADEEVCSYLIDDLEGRIFDLTGMTVVQLRCVHCGHAVRGNNREEAQAKLDNHIRKEHGWW